MKNDRFSPRPMEEWPKTTEGCEEITSDDPEVKRVMVNFLKAGENTNVVNQLMNTFSFWTKVRCTVAWFLKLKALLSDLCQKRKELCAAYSQSNSDENQQVQQVNTAMEKYKRQTECVQTILPSLESALNILDHSR